MQAGTESFLFDYIQSLRQLHLSKLILQHVKVFELKYQSLHIRHCHEDFLFILSGWKRQYLCTHTSDDAVTGAHYYLNMKVTEAMRKHELVLCANIISLMKVCFVIL